MKQNWMHVSKEFLLRLIERGFSRFVQSTEPVKETTNDSNQDER